MKWQHCLTQHHYHISVKQMLLCGFGKTPFTPTCRGLLDLSWGSWCEDGGSQQLTMGGFSLKDGLGSRRQA